ncbi:MAG TPA: phosphonate ABC transporter substrate-binding protein, partial [Delftia acidovorans]|nr:phosphonate ABC transporter substrate-binding protein [Delftia acidovorans]
MLSKPILKLSHGRNMSLLAFSHPHPPGDLAGDSRIHRSADVPDLMQRNPPMKMK